MKAPQLLQGISLLLVLFSSLLFAQGHVSLRVGLSLPLSGLAAEYGAAYKQGIDMARAEMPEAAKGIDLIYDDHRYDMKSVVSSVRKLVTRDKVNLLAVWGYAPSDTAAPLIREFSIPVLLNTVNPSARGQDMVVNLSPPSLPRQQILVDYLKRSQFSRVAIIGSQVGTLDQWVKEIADLIPSQTAVVATYSVLSSDMDLSGLAARVKAQRPDVVVLLMLPEQARVFIRRLREQHFEVPFVGADTFNSTLIGELFKDYKDGPVFFDSYIDPLFLERAKKAGPQISHATEIAQGYLFYMLLAYLAENVKPPYGAEPLIQALHSLPSGHGPAGEYEMRHSARFGWYLNTNPVLNQFKKGVVVPVNN